VRRGRTGSLLAEILLHPAVVMSDPYSLIGTAHQMSAASRPIAITAAVERHKLDPREDERSRD
jgi:hypothetical protein